MNTLNAQELLMYHKSFEERCEEYFISEYRKRVDGYLRDNIVPYSLLDGVEDDFLPYLLNDDLLFVTQRTENGTFSPWCFDEQETSVSGKNSRPDFESRILYDRLWEAYRIHPEEWVRVLSTICFDSPFKDQFFFWQMNHHFAGVTFERFTDLFNLVENCYGIDSVLRNIHQRLLELRQNLFSAGLGSVWDTEDDFSSPFTIGLQRYVRKQLENLIPMSLGESLGRLVPLPSTAVHVTLDTKTEFHKTSTTILFSTPGTGKTRCLLELLNKAFGMYILASDVPQESSGSEDTTLDNSTLLLPVRSNASEDTSSLHKALYAASFKIATLDVWELSDAIVSARLVVFDYFLKKFPMYRNDPPTWMQLQINCASRYDPFDLAWRLVRLDPGTFNEYMQCWAGQSTCDLIWCFDEAQTALENPIGEKFLDRMWFNIHNLNSKIILSGTALRLSDVMSMVDPWAMPYDEVHAQWRDWDDLLMTYWIATEHQRINDFLPFWNLYEQHIHGILMESRAVQQKYSGLQSVASYPLRTRAGRPLGFRLDLSNMEALTLLQQINKVQDRSQLSDQYTTLLNIRTAINYHCPMFFGRYRWSTLFIEEILKQAVISIQQCRSLAQLSINNAAEHAIEAAKKALRTQLFRIKDKSWAQDLYWMAIRADVYSQSSVIEDDTAQLVSEGFALVDILQSKDRIVRASLCEPLAVHAVMSYLREEKEYDRITTRFYSQLQVDNEDQGSIGKIAEYVLATKVDNFLQNSNDIISANHRKNFWNIISNAQSVDRIIASHSMDPLSDQSSRYEDYYIYKLDVPRPSEGNRGNIDSLDDKTIEIAQWIEKVVRKEQRSNFLFPKKIEGPDLMFFLNKGTNLILCAVQFKTGFTAHQPSKLTPGLGTLIKWLGSCQFSGDIVLIYVATSTIIKVKDFVDSVNTHYQNDQVLVRNSNRVYFCYIDRKNSASVWGETFQNLTIMMKGLDV